MARKATKRSTSGGDGLAQSPFDALQGLGSGLPAQPASGGQTHQAPPATAPKPQGAAAPAPFDGRKARIDLKPLKQGKGGKIVTELSGFPPQDHDARRLKALLKALQRETSGGGTLKGRAIELQGDHIATLIPLLERWNYRPVRAGG